MQGRQREHQEKPLLRQWRVRDDGGFSMISIVLSLLATALLVAILLGTTLKSNTTSDTSISNAPGVAEATSLQAQQSLSNGLTTVNAAAASAGGYGSLEPSALSASNPSVTFVTGPSTNASTISMSVAGGGGGGGGVVGGGGSITLADRSTNGTCWLVWKSGGATWYGAQTGLSSCTAPALTSTPSPGPVSSSIGWQQGSFPVA